MTMGDVHYFAHPGAGEVVHVAPGNTRRVLIATPELMQVEFCFEEGAVGALHSHPHIQVSYVAEGSFEVKINGQTEIIVTGGSYIVPSGLVHGVKALEKGRLIDVFTPTRADFL
jgi:quercetin dioxygenase-like cupin family protein